MDTNGVVYSKSGKPLKYSINYKGYCIVNFYIKGKRKGFGIHTLVARQFIPNDDKAKYQVNHKDGNKTNNHVENLEWTTPLENTRHAIEVLGITHRGKNNNRSKRIIAFNKNTKEELYKFDSLSDACRWFSNNYNLSYKTVKLSIWRVANGYRKSYRGLIWEYT